MLNVTYSFIQDGNVKTICILNESNPTKVREMDLKVDTMADVGTDIVMECKVHLDPVNSSTIPMYMEGQEGFELHPYIPEWHPAYELHRLRVG